VSEVLARWNGLPQEEAAREILPCCGSRTWATSMASKRPIQDEASLVTTSDAIWRSLGEADWLEAFRSHPRIGDPRAEEDAPAQSSAWSAQEQQKAATADEAVKMTLKWGNREYEQKVRADFYSLRNRKIRQRNPGDSAAALHNDEATELQQAAEEQRQIMRIRLRKWITG